jgi:hypothetical protein
VCPEVMCKASRIWESDHVRIRYSSMQSRDRHKGVRKGAALADKETVRPRRSQSTQESWRVTSMFEVSVVWGVLVAMVAVSHNGI